MKIVITSKKMYLWATIMFMMVAVVFYVMSLFFNSFIIPSLMMLFCSWISYIEFKVEILNEKLNEPKPPQQD